MDKALIIPLILLLIVTIVMVYMLWQGQKGNQRQRALSIIAGKSSAAESRNQELEDKDKRRSNLARKLKESSKSGTQGKNTILDLLKQAGFSETPQKNYWIYSFIVSVVMVIAAKLMGQAIIVVAFAGVIGFFGLPKMFLRSKIKRRQKKFLEEFADALESMVRLLKAGMPVGEAILMVSREYGGPVGEEMTRVYDEQKIGVPLAEACLNAARRMPIAEMQMFATGISIQQQTGSSLSEVLLNLAKVIRARFRLKRKVQALSAEAKASASIIGALPVFVATGLYLINPGYMELLFITHTGKILATAAVTWMMIGVMVMKQMINFKV